MSTPPFDVPLIRENPMVRIEEKWRETHPSVIKGERKIVDEGEVNEHLAHKVI